MKNRRRKNNVKYQSFERIIETIKWDMQMNCMYILPCEEKCEKEEYSFINNDNMLMKNAIKTYEENSIQQFLINV